MGDHSTDDIISDFQIKIEAPDDVEEESTFILPSTSTVGEL